MALASYYKKIDEYNSDKTAPILVIPPKPVKRPKGDDESKAEYKLYLSTEFKPLLAKWEVS